MVKGALIASKKKNSILALEEDVLEVPYSEGIVNPEFVDEETRTCKRLEPDELPRLDPKYFCIGIVFKPESQFDEHDRQLRDIIERKLRDQWFMVAERRTTVDESAASDEQRYLLVGVTEQWLELAAERLYWELPLRNPPRGTGCVYRPYEISKKNKFKSYDGCVETDEPTGSVFTPATRIAIVHRVLEDTLKYALHLPPVKKVFPLHNNQEVKQIGKNTGNIMFWPLVSRRRRTIFLELIRRYFGERRSLYFAFILFYTLTLVPIAVLGAVASGVFKDRNLRVYGEPVWVTLLMMWTASWIVFWIRLRNDWAYSWGTLGFKGRVKERVQFTGKSVFNEITNQMEKEYPDWKRLLYRYSVSAFVMALMVICAALMVVACIVFRGAQLLPGFWSYKAAGFLMGLSSHAANHVMGNVAKALTDFENHREAHSWENQYILKTFAIYSVNSFMYFYYVTFLQGRLKSYFGIDVWWDSPCPENDCVHVLELLVCYHMLASIFVQQILEIAVPFGMYWLRVKCARKSNDGDDVNAHFLKYADKQRKRDPLNVFDDYAEMVLQFGLVSLFGAAFPLAPLLAVCNNITEIFFDYFKYVLIGGRPVPQKAEDIGTWLLCIKITAFFSILTNAAYLCFVSTTSSVRGQSWTTKAFAFFVLEHVFVLIQYALHTAIPKKTRSLKTKLRKVADYHHLESVKAQRDRDQLFQELSEQRGREIRERQHAEKARANSGTIKNVEDDDGEDQPLLGGTPNKTLSFGLFGRGETKQSDT